MDRVRRRLPPTSDIVLAVVFAVLALAELEVNDPDQSSAPTQVVFSLAIALPLAWRRTQPVQAAAVSFAAMAAGLLAGIAVTDGFVPLLIFGIAVYAVARADVLEDELDEHTERAALQERERIARELHDVVAHRLSTIAVQAGAGQHVLHEDPERARATFEAIDDTARSGLTEMRHALGLLRATDAGAALSPQPSLRDVARLAEESRAAGVPVELTVRGDMAALPAGLDLSAYRILQEALTNVRRHAAGAPATVDVTVDGGLVRLRVTDAGPAAVARPEDAADPGHGLVGIRERVALYGGSLEAGPLPGGGFLVSATLPLNGTA
jgi:signal transduction histidine kinase